MVASQLPELDSPVRETVRDRLLRESFLLGFVVLLILVVGMGVLSYRRIGGVESEITRRSLINQQNLKTAFQLQEQAGRLAAEVRTLKVTSAYGGKTFAVAHRITQLRKQIDTTLDKGRETSLASEPAWGEVESAYALYSSNLRDEAPLPDAVEEQWNVALHDLLEATQRDVYEAEDLAAHMRRDAQRDILVTTIACVVLGLLVSALSFFDARMRIVQLRRAYARVTQSKEFIESTLEGMDSAVLTLNLAGTVTRINGAALHVLGFARADDVVDHNVSEILAEQPALRAMVEPLVGAQTYDGRYLGRIELGNEAWLFDVGASPLTIAGEVRGYIVTLTDVTEAERSSAELRRNRALMAVGQMTTQVAHEIKNPLGGVRLAAQVLARKLKHDEQSLEVIRRIESSVDHLDRTVRDLNQFARPRELELTSVQLERLLDDLLEMVGDRIETKRIEVVRSYAADLPAGRYDEGELRKAFINFLINALDASEEGAALFVEVARMPDLEAVRIVIRDQGHGMDEQTLRRLFEPFFTTKSHGTGLGMAIARRILELHNGRLEVASEVGVGTTVTATLPLAPASVMEIGAGLEGNA